MRGYGGFRFEPLEESLKLNAQFERILGTAPHVSASKHYLELKRGFLFHRADSS